MAEDAAELSRIGLYGLAVMGQNFALNIAEHGFPISVCNRSPAKIDTTVARAAAEGNLPLKGFHDPEEFVKSIAKPRAIVILVMAGAPVDATIELLSSFMEEGDCIIDGGNEWYPNSVRRAEMLKEKGMLFVGMGISGGEEGARHGPSLMPGGPRAAFDMVAPILESCSAQVDNEPCTFYIGPVGSGNYVKMVHNGIEYGDMQLIAEAYDVLKQCAGLSNDELAEVFAAWNQTEELDSFLIEITSIIFTKKDDLEDDGYLVDKILDKTGMKGTGRWTIQEAAEQSVAASTMAAALDVRYMSARKDERVTASAILEGPSQIPSVAKEQIIADVKDALYAAKICSYAQGMSLIRAASDKMNWGVNLSECARIWRGGCIIRARFLDRIRAAFTADPKLPNLMIDPAFSSDLNQRQAAWRRIVSLGVASGIAVPGLAASLNYFDSYRRPRLPANLTQAQRDFFGGHSYERTDRPGNFHCEWTEAHKDIGSVAERNLGNV